MELHYVVSDHVHLGNVLLLPLSFVESIYFNSLFFIIFSMYLLHFLVVWCCLEQIKKKPIKSQIYTCSSILWFKFYRYTLESYFWVDFRFYHFSIIIFLCWTFGSSFSCKILIRKENTKNLSINHFIHVVLESYLAIIIVTLCSNFVKFVLNFDFID